jgi:hypothetical protein
MLVKILHFVFIHTKKDLKCTYSRDPSFPQKANIDTQNDFGGNYTGETHEELKPRGNNTKKM